MTERAFRLIADTRTIAPLRAPENLAPERRPVDRESLGRILATAGAARARRMTIEETFIFLGVGYLGVTATRSGHAVTPVSCSDIAALLSIPKETVRRKAHSLEILGLLVKTTRGVAIRNVDDWREFASAFLPSRAQAAS